MIQALPLTQGVLGVIVYYTSYPPQPVGARMAPTAMAGPVDLSTTGTSRRLSTYTDHNRLTEVKTWHARWPGDDIILDKMRVVKATPIPRKGVVKAQDYRGHSYHNVSSKNLRVRWTPGHRNIRNATTYHYYLDMNGNNECDALAHMGDNCPWILPTPGHITSFCTVKLCPLW